VPSSSTATSRAAVRARGDPVADASVVVGAVRVFDGVGDGLPQCELEVVDELGGVRGARPPLHGEPDLAQLVGPSGDLAAERGGQQLHEQRGDVVARTGLGEHVADHRGQHRGHRSPAPAVRGVREAAHAVVDELTSALDEPVGVEQHAVARLEHQVRLGHRRRVPQPEHRTEDAVREAGAFGVDRATAVGARRRPRSARPW
jgi:hypothetical protein